MSDETALLQALFAAAMGRGAGGAAAARGDLWSEFLQLLAQITQAGSAELRFSGAAGAGPAGACWRAGAGWPGPEMAVLERMRTGRVYSQVDLPAPPAGGVAQPLRALRLRLAEGGLALLTLQRTGEDFRATDGLHLAALAPHLGPALSGWRQLQAERAGAALDRQIGAGLGAGWMVFSATGQVSAMAAGLEAQLRGLAGITLRADGRLALPGPAAQALRQALAAVAQEGAQEEGSGRALTLSAAPRIELVLRRETLAGAPALVGRLRHALAARDLPPERLALRLGLSRSEARLAACLCDGLSLAEAAQALGWTPETARSTSKQVYARLGVGGQTGVLRRVLGSAVWLG